MHWPDRTSIEPLRTVTVMVAALVCAFPAAAQERRAPLSVEGVWSPPFTTQQSPVWTIADQLCDGCSAAAYEHLESSLADPANDSRPLGELAAEAQQMSFRQFANLTEAGRGRRSQYVATATPDCASPALLSLLAAPLPMSIGVEGDTVVVHHDEWNVERRIPLDSDDAWPDAPVSRLGTSRAHFDGDVLVVETRNLAANVNIAFSTVDGARIVERYAPRNDGLRLDLTIGVYDPETFRAPIELVQRKLRTPEVVLGDYPSCEGAAQPLGDRHD